MLEASLSEIVAKIAPALESLPSKLRKKYAWLKSTQLDMIQLEIVEALNDAAEVRLTIPDELREMDDTIDDQ